MELNTKFLMIGLMSGTSLDGLDVVNVSFELKKKEWLFEICCAKTYPYPKELKERLSSATKLSGGALKKLDVKLGVFMGNCVNEFIALHRIEKSTLVAVSSHGHTVFHEPKKGVTMQIGNGPQGAVITGVPWVCDFRVLDVAKGGNGAPLVPIGDSLLFGKEADAFLNLGGFSNISFKKKEEWTAFDICPVNLIFNYFANYYQLDFDEGGSLAKNGSLIPELYDALNGLSYYSEESPKSLGIEWLEEFFFPLIKGYPIDENVIYTAYQHVAFQLSKTFEENQLDSVMVTGGGVKNSFLIKTIEKMFKGRLIIPSVEVVDFKEALIFAFLGLLRIREEINVLSSVTGAYGDSVSGYIHLP